MNTHTKVEKVPYWVKLVTVFFFGWVAIYAGRAVLNPLMGYIQQEFALSASSLGLISSLFFLTYTALQVPSGILADKIGRKLLLVPSFFCFALFIIGAGLSSSFYMFIFFWMLTGAAQGAFYGPQYGLSSENIPKKWITFGSAIINSGMAFGISLGYFISSRLVETYHMSWKAPFLAVSVPILLVAIALLLIIKNDRISSQAKAASVDIKNKSNFLSLFKNRNLIIAYITIFCSIYGFFVIITWLPYYLHVERGFDKIAASDLASIVPWIAIVGSLFFSFMSDKLGRRKPVVLLMMPLSLIAIAGIVYSSTTTVLIMSLVLYGLIGKISLNPVLVALVADNAPKELYSTSFGLYNFFGMSSSILAPYLTGLIAEKTGSLNSGFYLAAVITAIGIFCMFFVNEDNPPNK